MQRTPGRFLGVGRFGVFWLAFAAFIIVGAVTVVPKENFKLRARYKNRALM